MIDTIVHFIDNSDSLKHHCALAQNAQCIGLDTEFIRNAKTYYPILSLVQISYANTIAVIDILSPELNLEPLKHLLTSESVLKIIHSSRQDIESIYFKLGIVPKPIFDTQLAMMFLGFEDNPGYELLVKTYVGDITILKDLQYSDWLSRPLSDKQISYASMDVRFLIEAFNKIMDTINKDDNRKVKWILEESQNIALNAISEPDYNQILCGICSKMNDTTLILLRRIIIWREKVACKCNLQRDIVLKTNSISKLINTLVNNIISETTIDGNLITQMLHSAKSINPKYLSGLNKFLSRPITIKERNHIKLIPNNKKRTSNKLYSTMYYLLKTLLHIVSFDFRIATSIIASKDDIIKISNKIWPKKFKRGNWRYLVFTSAINNLINGDTSIAIKDSKAYLKKSISMKY